MMNLPKRLIVGIAATAVLASACSAPPAQPTTAPAVAPTVVTQPAATDVVAGRPLFIDFYAPW